MKTEVTFKSNKFPSYNDESEGVNWNAGIYGRRLSEYLEQKLPLKGIDTTGGIDEDFGWFMSINHSKDFKLNLVCAIYDEDQNIFMIAIHPNKPVIKKLFKKIDVSEDVKKLADTIDEILKEDPEISEIKWNE